MTATSDREPIEPSRHKFRPNGHCYNCYLPQSQCIYTVCEADLWRGRWSDEKNRQSRLQEAFDVIRAEYMPEAEED